MDRKKRALSAEKAYDAFADQNGLLYHIAHARKENSSEPYNGEALVKRSKETVRHDIQRFRASAQRFKERSIQRD